MLTGREEDFPGRRELLSSREEAFPNGSGWLSGRDGSRPERLSRERSRATIETIAWYDFADFRTFIPNGGLIREDKAFLYPIVSGIPVMLIDKGIPANQLEG